MSELDEFMKVLSFVGICMLGLCFVLFSLTAGVNVSGSSAHGVIRAFYNYVVTSPNMVKLTMVGFYLMVAIFKLCASDTDVDVKFRDIVVIIVIVVIGWMSVDYLVAGHSSNNMDSQSQSVSEAFHNLS
jgi:hypothetical protein